jgi:arsenate reductase
LLYIRAAGHEPRIVDYVRTPLSRDAIASLARLVGTPVRSLARSKEPLFRELGLDERDVTENELLDAMAANPLLLNRPIVAVEREGKTTARLCRPSETVKDLLAKASANAQ